MALHNFKRPDLPYDNVPLPNDNRFAVTTNQKKPIPVAMLEGENNYLIDSLNQLDVDINNISAGIVPGSNIPANAGLFITTDGAPQPTLSFVRPSGDSFLDATIPGVKIVDQSITMQQMGNASVGADQIQNFSITSTKIALDSVTNSKILSKTITARAIADQAITALQIANSTITAAQIADRTITALQIANSTITAAQIAAKTITAAQIADRTITALQIANSTITAAQIAAKTITAAQIADNTITFGQISNSFAATKSQQQVASSSSVFVSPATQQHHPSAVSFWCYFDGTNTGTNAPLAGYNVTSVTRTTNGTYRINYNNNFSTNKYGVFGTSGPGAYTVSPLSLATSSCIIENRAPNGIATDQPIICVQGMGVLA